MTEMTVYFRQDGVEVDVLELPKLAVAPDGWYEWGAIYLTGPFDPERDIAPCRVVSVGGDASAIGHITRELWDDLPPQFRGKADA